MIPYSETAERSVLGSLTIDGSAFDRVGDVLVSQSFYALKHQLIFESMKAVNDTGALIDVVTVSDHLERRGELDDVGGIKYLIEIAEQCVGSQNIERWADVIREAHSKRETLAAANAIIENTTAEMDEPQTAAQIIEFAESRIMSVGDLTTKQRGGPKPVRDAVDDHLADVIARKESGKKVGLMTGYADFDRMTGGLKAGNLIYLAGVPGAGKTSLALNIATNIATRQHDPKTVLVFSLEMPEAELHDRNLASVGGVSLTGITQGTFGEGDYSRIIDATAKLRATNLIIDETGALTPSEVRSRSRRVHRKAEGGVSLIVIDYVQLMQVTDSKKNGNDKTTEISNTLKAIAKELKCPILALSQLNRGYASRVEKRPVMSDLRDSGSLEQDADLIAFLYTDDPDNSTLPTELIIRKQRAGPTGTILLMFEKIFTRFKSHSDRHTPFTDDQRYSA